MRREAATALAERRGVNVSLSFDFDADSGAGWRGLGDKLIGYRSRMELTPDTSELVCATSLAFGQSLGNR